MTKNKINCIILSESKRRDIMFNGLRDQVMALNNDVNNVANSEKAKALRSKLLKIGVPLLVLGVLGVLGCFTAFTISSINSVNSGATAGFPVGVIVPFLLFLPSGMLMAVGGTITSLGVKIVITGYTSKLISDEAGNNCPNCSDPIGEGETFCTKCGTKLFNKCVKCETMNSEKDKFCKKCGNDITN